MTNLAPRPRFLLGAVAIAGYIGMPERWLRKQLERSKHAPPVWKFAGTQLAAYPHELDAWVDQWRQRKAAR